MSPVATTRLAAHTTKTHETATTKPTLENASAGVVYPETEIRAAAREMSDRSTDRVLVSDGKAIIGAVSNSDIIRHVADGAQSTLVGSIMQFDTDQTDTFQAREGVTEGEPTAATMRRGAADARNTVFAVVEHHSYTSDANEHGARIVHARLFGHDEHIEILLKPGHAAVTYHPSDLIIAEGVRRTQANGPLVFEAELTVRVEAPLSYSPEMPSTNGPIKTA